MAQVIGVSLRTIQNYEAGKVDIPSKKLELIAQHYSVTVAYLFGGKEVEEKKEFKDLKIDDKLNVMYNMMQAVLDVTGKAERNEKSIMQTNKSLLEYSTTLQDILEEIEVDKVKKSS